LLRIQPGGYNRPHGENLLKNETNTQKEVKRWRIDIPSVTFFEPLDPALPEENRSFGFLIS